MNIIVTNEQMKALDAHTVKEKELPALVLMERAAMAVVEVLNKEAFDLSKVLVVCGSGNNGGDGIAIGRLLYLAGKTVDVCLAGNREKISEECCIQQKIAENYGITFVKNFRSYEYTTIVDAVFGVGLSRMISEEYQELFRQINQTNAKVLAVDIPSGVHSDHGKIMGGAVHAAVTVTFAYGKSGLLLYPGAGYAGKVIVKDVGIYDENPSLLIKVSKQISIRAIEKEDIRFLPLRQRQGNKGTFGKVLLIAGSHNMAGAACLCGKACFRSGAGMVKIHTVQTNRRILQESLPEAMLSTYPDECGKDIDGEGMAAADNSGDQELQRSIDWCDVIAIGPGLGTGTAAEKILAYLLKHTSKPLIIDGDGLNLLSRKIDLLKQYPGVCVITPHIGEMARLTGQDSGEIKNCLLESARSFAQAHQVICVLKDARTVIAAPDGIRCFINTSGNSGMATAGSGDVLTGILAGIMAQSQRGRTDVVLAALCVYLHGWAGDRARKKLGARAMMAGDLIEAFTGILKKYEKEEEL